MNRKTVSTTVSTIIICITSSMCVFSNLRIAQERFINVFSIEIPVTFSLFFRANRKFSLPKKLPQIGPFGTKNYIANFGSLRHPPNLKFICPKSSAESPQRTQRPMVILMAVISPHTFFHIFSMSIKNSIIFFKYSNLMKNYYSRYG